MGFDLIDDVLDICVQPDRSYFWQDEEEMVQLVELGIYSRSDSEELREVGREVLDLVSARKPPFDDEWIDWRPTPDLALGEVPDGWQFLPVPSPYQSYSP